MSPQEVEVEDKKENQVEKKVSNPPEARAARAEAGETSTTLSLFDPAHTIGKPGSPERLLSRLRLSPELRAEGAALVAARLADGLTLEDLLLTYRWGRQDIWDSGGAHHWAGRLSWLWGPKCAENLVRARAWHANPQGTYNNGKLRAGYGDADETTARQLQFRLSLLSRETDPKRIAESRRALCTDLGMTDAEIDASLAERRRPALPSAPEAALPPPAVEPEPGPVRSPQPAKADTRSFDVEDRDEPEAMP